MRFIFLRKLHGWVFNPTQWNRNSTKKPFERRIRTHHTANHSFVDSFSALIFNLIWPGWGGGGQCPHLWEFIKSRRRFTSIDLILVHLSGLYYCWIQSSQAKGYLFPTGYHWFRRADIANFQELPVALIHEIISANSKPELKHLSAQIIKRAATLLEPKCLFIHRERILQFLVKRHVNRTSRHLSHVRPRCSERPVSRKHHNMRTDLFFYGLSLSIAVYVMFTIKCHSHHFILSVPVHIYW